MTSATASIGSQFRSLIQETLGDQAVIAQAHEDLMGEGPFRAHYVIDLGRVTEMGNRLALDIRAYSNLSGDRIILEMRTQAVTARFEVPDRRKNHEVWEDLQCLDPFVNLPSIQVDSFGDLNMSTGRVAWEALQLYRDMQDLAFGIIDIEL